MGGKGWIWRKPWEKINEWRKYYSNGGRKEGWIKLATRLPRKLFPEFPMQMREDFGALQSSARYTSRLTERGTSLLLEGVILRFNFIEDLKDSLGMRILPLRYSRTIADTTLRELSWEGLVGASSSRERQWAGESTLPTVDSQPWALLLESVSHPEAVIRLRAQGSSIPFHSLSAEVTESLGHGANRKDHRTCQFSGWDRGAGQVWKKQKET